LTKQGISPRFRGSEDSNQDSESNRNIWYLNESDFLVIVVHPNDEIIALWPNRFGPSANGFYHSAGTISNTIIRIQLDSQAESDQTDIVTTSRFEILAEHATTHIVRNDGMGGTTLQSFSGRILQ